MGTVRGSPVTCTGAAGSLAWGPGVWRWNGGRRQIPCWGGTFDPPPPRGASLRIPVSQTQRQRLRGVTPGTPGPMFTCGWAQAGDRAGWGPVNHMGKGPRAGPPATVGKRSPGPEGLLAAEGSGTHQVCPDGAGALGPSLEPQRLPGPPAPPSSSPTSRTLGLRVGQRCSSAPSATRSPHTLGICVAR